MQWTNEVVWKPVWPYPRRRTRTRWWRNRRRKCWGRGWVLWAQVKKKPCQRTVRLRRLMIHLKPYHNKVPIKLNKYEKFVVDDFAEMMNESSPYLAILESKFLGYYFWESSALFFFTCEWCEREGHLVIQTDNLEVCNNSIKLKSLSARQNCAWELVEVVVVEQARIRRRRPSRCRRSSKSGGCRSSSSSCSRSLIRITPPWHYSPPVWSCATIAAAWTKGQRWRWL